MNKEEKQQTIYNQLAMILNYQPHIEHQHNYVGGKPEEDFAETNADEEKRKKLMASNNVIRTQTQSGKPTVDILKLYEYIDRFFVSEIAYKYEWYALRRFLERYNLLRECDNEKFASQMNDDEWFGHSQKSCEANEINIYNYLNDIHPDKWCDTSIPYGSKATNKSVVKVYTTYSNLELYKDQIIGR